MALYAQPGSPHSKFSVKPCCENWIGGSWAKPVEGPHFKDIPPVKGKEFCEVARGTAEDTELALVAPHRAAPAWGKTPAAHRADILNTIADAIESNLEALATPETWDIGRFLWRVRPVRHRCFPASGRTRPSSGSRRPSLTGPLHPRRKFRRSNRTVCAVLCEGVPAAVAFLSFRRSRVRARGFETPQAATLPAGTLPDATVGAATLPTAVSGRCRVARPSRRKLRKLRTRRTSITCR